MKLYYITRNAVGSMEDAFLYEHFSDRIVSSLEELTDDDKMILLNESQTALFSKYADYLVEKPFDVYNMIAPSLETINTKIRKKRESKYAAETDRLYMAYVKYKEFGDEIAAAEAYNEWRTAVQNVKEANPYITE